MSNVVHQPQASLELLKELLLPIPYESHLKVHTCYNLTVPSHWGIDNRMNTDYHIVFVRGGEGSYRVGERLIPFEKGQIIFVSRGMLHTGKRHTENAPSIIPVRFGFYDNRSREDSPGAVSPFGFSYVSPDWPAYQHLFEQLHKQYKKADSRFSELLCGTLLCEILQKLAVELSDADQHGGGSDARVEKVRKFMDENPHLRYQPEQYADLADLSEKYFRALFKRQVGETPFEYQLRARMEHARYLLAESGQSIKHVALSIGYPDPYAFSKQFKQVMGYPPGQLRR